MKPQQIITEMLYSRRSDGKVQTWQAEIQGDEYRMHSGILDGEKVISTWTKAKPKNLGKKNETSGEEQAIAEVESHRKKKLDKGYKESIDDVDDTAFEVMLAKDYNDYDISFPIYTQPKLDGCRCHTSRGQMSYRSNKPVISCPHIINALVPIFDKYPDLRLDGEIYAHKFKDNFNEIISLARKTKPTKQDLKDSETHLEYHIYDCFLGGQEKFSERYKFLKKLSSSFSGPLKLVDTHCVSNQDELDKLYADWVAEGYEGQMVRFDKAYENKRSKFLLKRKEFQDTEFTIVNITEGDGNRSGMAGRCHFLTVDGKEFTANIMGGSALYIELLRNKNKYIGKEATVKFFNWTPDGLPRFPVVTKLEK